MSATKRVATEELIDEPFAAKRAKPTGRPTRQNAGRRSLAAGFVRTEDVITKNDDEDSDSESEPDDNGRHSRLFHKRRAPSPPPPALPEEHRDLPLDGPLSSVSSTAPSTRQLSLTFHVPPGHQGPFVVNLQLPTGNMNYNNFPTDSLSKTGTSITASSFDSLNTHASSLISGRKIRSLKPKHGVLHDFGPIGSGKSSQHCSHQ